MNGKNETGNNPVQPRGETKEDANGKKNLREENAQRIRTI